MKLFGEKNTNREVGSNFDKDVADEIFDKLDKIDTDESKKSDKKIESQAKDVSHLLNEAKNADDDKALELFRKVLVIMPDSVEAYEGIADIYRKQNDSENEIMILKQAIQNLDGNSKSIFIKRLKELS